MPQTRENSLPHFRKNKCHFFGKSTCRLQETRGANPEYLESLKRWRSECESAQVDGLESNSIGSIFFLKSNFSWRETAPAAPEDYITTVQSTPEQIMERHKDAKRPAIPDIDKW